MTIICYGGASMQWTKDIIQKLIVNQIAIWISAIGAFLLAWCKYMDWNMVSPLLYFLITFASILIIWNQVKIISSKKNLSLLKPEQMEQELRRKLDILGYKTGKIMNDTVNFAFSVTDSNGLTISVAQSKTNSDIITITARYSFGPQIQHMNRLSAQKKNQLLNELLLIASRQGISYASSTLENIPLDDLLLIEDLKNASSFIQRVRAMFLLYYSMLNVLASFTTKEMTETALQKAQ